MQITAAEDTMTNRALTVENQPTPMPWTPGRHTAVAIAANRYLMK